MPVLLIQNLEPDTRSRGGGLPHHSDPATYAPVSLSFEFGRVLQRTLHPELQCHQQGAALLALQGESSKPGKCSTCQTMLHDGTGYSIECTARILAVPASQNMYSSPACTIDLPQNVCQQLTMPCSNRKLLTALGADSMCKHG